jgi:hypothetical protein
MIVMVFNQVLWESQRLHASFPQPLSDTSEFLHQKARAL